MNAPQTIEMADWTDRKKYLWLLGPAVPLTGLAVAAGYHLAPKKLRWLSLLAPALAYGVIPLADRFFGEDPGSPPRSSFKQLLSEKYYDAVITAYVPLQLALVIYGAWVVTRRGVPLADQILFAISLGIVNALATSVAHEFSHRPGRREQMLSHAALAPLAYNHFRVEHVYGHHRRVATPEDPASARMGESFYAYLPRAITGGLKSAVDIQKKRMARRGKPFFSRSNELLWGWGGSALLLGGLGLVCGPRSWPLLALQGAYGVVQFEGVNYLEHYGLMRARKPDGSYERTLPEHSWNNNNIISNVVMFQLQRHSDHHAFPTHAYQLLRHFEDSPQLPAGYPAMLLAAAIPPLWFKIMDRRLLEFYQGDLSKINISPKKRKKIYARYMDRHVQGLKKRLVAG